MVTWESELSQLLENERILLEGIADCESKKTQLLAKGDIENINKILNRERPLSIQCQTSETKRIALMTKYKLIGKTFHEVCHLADDKYKNLLEAQHEALRIIANKIKKTNTINSELTKSRLEFYGKIRLMVTKPIYGYDGTISQKSQGGRSLIDRKV
jgi:hypothetical protein